jgi:hypothetical protein
MLYQSSLLPGILCHVARKLIHGATLFMKIGYDLSNPRRTASCRNFQNLEFMHEVSICILQFWKMPTANQGRNSDSYRRKLNPFPLTMRKL